MLREQPAMLVALVMLLGIAALFAVDRLGCWMERRGWIYWRKRERKGGGGMSGVLSEFQQLVEPEVRHVIEAREQDRAMKVDFEGKRDDRGQGSPRSE